MSCGTLHEHIVVTQPMRGRPSLLPARHLRRCRRRHSCTSLSSSSLSSSITVTCALPSPPPSPPSSPSSPSVNPLFPTSHISPPCSHIRALITFLQRYRSQAAWMVHKQVVLETFMPHPRTPALLSQPAKVQNTIKVIFEECMKFVYSYSSHDQHWQRRSAPH